MIEVVESEKVRGAARQPKESKMYHGTSRDAAQKIAEASLAPGQYVSPLFEMAASYALRHAAPAIVEVEGPTTAPDEEAYEDGWEAVAAGTMTALHVFVPKLAGKPSDWYEIAGDVSGRKYPELFDLKNWEEIQ